MQFLLVLKIVFNYKGLFMVVKGTGKKEVTLPGAVGSWIMKNAPLWQGIFHR